MYIIASLHETFENPGEEFYEIRRAILNKGQI